MSTTKSFEDNIVSINMNIKSNKPEAYMYEQQKRQERKNDKNLRNMRKNRKNIWVAHSERVE